MILAAGEQKRWHQYKFTDIPFKHLAVVDGERVIDRNIRLFGGEVIICDFLKPFVDGTIVECGGCILERMLGQLKENIFILGDVYFTDKAAELINNFSGFVLFGSHKKEEIYAIKFDDKERLRQLIIKTLKMRGDGKLWDLYYELTGINNQYVKSEYMVEINDETQDFDTQHIYVTWLKEYERNRV